MKREDFGFIALALILALAIFAIGSQYGKSWAIHNARWDGWTGNTAGNNAEYAISYGDDTHGWTTHVYTVEVDDED